MKKSISVNIKGAIFNIEEDAFSTLKEYLDSLKNYFSNYEDSTEIYDDIEARVAELLHAKLNKEKEVIEANDVNQVIAAMGKLEDFVEMEDDFKQEEQTDYTSEQTNNQNKKHSEEKRFYKDSTRKMISGVCAGIAHYFSIDPFWIRLVFILVFFATAVFPIFITYIILAIILPANNKLEENTVKKLFRNGEEGIIGGVSSGIAKFLGTDPVIIRVIFVIAAFSGFGILTYFIFWLIVPEAKTRSEKMQMEGEPITISNIEKNIKDNLNLKDENGNESTLATILLFPFRFIAQIFNGIAPLIKPFATFFIQFIRFVGGFGLLSVGLALITTFSIALAVGIGFIDPSHPLIHSNIPLPLFLNSVPFIGVIAVFFVGFFPSLIFILLGISLFSKKSIVRPVIFGAIFGLWIISIGVLTGTVGYIIKDYSDEGKIKKQEVIAINGDELIIELNDNDSNFENVDLTIKTSIDSNYKLVQHIESKGSSISKAKENARQAKYNYKIVGNTIIFDQSTTYDDTSTFKFEEISLQLYVPQGKKVRISEEILYSMLRKRHFSTSPSIYSDFGELLDFKDRIWKSNKNEFTCINCEDVSHYDHEYDHSTDYSTDDNSVIYQLQNFSKINISDAFDVSIKQGDKFKVKAFANDHDLENIEIEVEQEWLTLEYVNDKPMDFIDFAENKRRIKVQIELPMLEEIDMSGATKADLKVKDLENLVIELSGASQLEANAINISNCDIDISGASILNIEGSSVVLSAEVSGASQLDAKDLISDVVVAETSGASTVKVYAKEKLEAETSGISTIKYRGNPAVKDISEDGLSKIKKY